jgi:hypothetical protein
VRRVWQIPKKIIEEEDKIMYGDRDHQETGNNGKGKNNSESNILETVEEEDEDDAKYLEAMEANDTLLDLDDIEDAEDVAGFEFVDPEGDEDDYVM